MLKTIIVYLKNVFRKKSKYVFSDIKIVDRGVTFNVSLYKRIKQFKIINNDTKNQIN